MRQKKLKAQKYETEDVKEIRNLIIITLIIIVLSVGLYYLTNVIIEKNKTVTEAEISSEEITVGTIFNRPSKEYFVFLYDKTTNEAAIYDNLFENYKNGPMSRRIYFVDLSLKFNSGVLSEESNKKPKNPSELKVKESALIHIKEGKVVEYFETTEEYQKVLN